MHRYARLSVDLASSASAPAEVRLFRAGENKSDKGTFFLDIDSVLASWEEHAGGLDHGGMIDLEHLSLDPDSPNFDPDARGWYELEARDGELWLTDIRWTPEGEARVTDRRQRYLSPTFEFDDDARVVRVINVALTALPALHGAPELIAARSAAASEVNMAEDNAKAVADILKAMGIDPKMPAKVATALGLDASASVDDIRAALDSFAAKMAKVEDLLADGEGASEDEGAPAEPESPPAEPDGGAMAEAPVEEKKEDEEASTLAAKLREELIELRAFRDSIEETQRHDLVARMVALGAEAPATAWADDDASKPAEPWASMPLVALRARVQKLEAKPARNDAPIAPAQGSALTERQLEICKEYGIDPARFARMRAAAGRTA